MSSYAEQMAAESALEATSAVLQVPTTPKSAHLTAPTSPYANHDLSKSCSSALPSPSLATKLESKSKDIFSWTDAELASKYQFIEEVGYGMWGSVWKCEGRATNAVVAVKLVHRSKTSTTAARVRSLWNEFKILRSFKHHPHPNLVKFTDFVITPSYALVVMDYHPRLIPVELPESKAKVYFKQLISAVGYLHTLGVAHNDIKPSNILLSENDVPKLCDFGFASVSSLGAIEEGKVPFRSSLSWGTPEYLSPERAKGRDHDERLADIWSLGVSMYEICVGRTPFEADSSEEFLTKEALEVYYQRTLTNRFYGVHNISPSFASLISQMVESDVDMRIQTCAQAEEHEFFASLKPARRPKLANHGSLSAESKSTLSLAARPTSYTPVLGEISNNSLCQTPRSSGRQLKTVASSPSTPKRKAVPVKVYRDEAPANVVAPALPSTPRTPGRTQPRIQVSTPSSARRPKIPDATNENTPVRYEVKANKAKPDRTSSLSFSTAYRPPTPSKDYMPPVPSLRAVEDTTQELLSTPAAPIADTASPVKKVADKPYGDIMPTRLNERTTSALSSPEVTRLTNKPSRLHKPRRTLSTKSSSLSLHTLASALTRSKSVSRSRDTTSRPSSSFSMVDGESIESSSLMAADQSGSSGGSRQEDNADNISDKAQEFSAKLQSIVNEARKSYSEEERRSSPFRPASARSLKVKGTPPSNRAELPTKTRARSFTAPTGSVQEAMRASLTPSFIVNNDKRNAVHSDTPPALPAKSGSINSKSSAASASTATPRRVTSPLPTVPRVVQQTPFTELRFQTAPAARTGPILRTDFLETNSFRGTSFDNREILRKSCDFSRDFSEEAAARPSFSSTKSAFSLRSKFMSRPKTPTPSTLSQSQEKHGFKHIISKLFK